MKISLNNEWGREWVGRRTREKSIYLIEYFATLNRLTCE